LSGEELDNVHDLLRTAAATERADLMVSAAGRMRLSSRFIGVS
jgi:hypothetical protein